MGSSETARRRSSRSPSIAISRPRVTPRITRLGRQQAMEQSAVLRRIRSEYGVSQASSLAIWGLEVALQGVHRRLPRVPGARHPSIGAASIGFLPKRAVQGAVDRGRRLHRCEDDDAGSWAGAMGQPQFWCRRAISSTRSISTATASRRDIWRSEGGHARLGLRTI